MEKKLKPFFVEATDEEIKAAEDRLDNHPEYYNEEDNKPDNIIKLRHDLPKDRKEAESLEGKIVGYIASGDPRQPRLPVVYMDQLMHANVPELNFACFTHTWFTTAPEKVVACIMIDNLFMQCGKGIQKFFLLHEIGHFKNKDIEDLIGKTVEECCNCSSTVRNDLDAELKADAYAFMRLDHQDQDGIIGAFSNLARRISEVGGEINDHMAAILAHRVKSMLELQDAMRSATSDKEIKIS